MKAVEDHKKRKRSLKKTIRWISGVLFVIIIIAGIFIYNNFNRLLTDALIKSFNSNIASDVYELKFEKLSANFLTGDISVQNVELKPREKPLVNYPYINSSFRLSTKEMNLKDVQLFTLIKSQILKLERIEIIKPDVELLIEDKIPIFIPFKDTAGAGQAAKRKKKSIESFLLKEFKLIDASFLVTNLAKQRKLSIQHLSISLRDMLINQFAGKDIMTYKNINLTIGKVAGTLHKEAIKLVSFKDFELNIDSLEIQKSVDTMSYHFADLSLGINALDIQTADSIFHLTMQSFDLSYRNSSIKLQQVSFKPNVSEALLDTAFKYQHTQFSGSVGTLNLTGVNFDSLIYNRKLFIDEVVLDKVNAAVFKDKTKPMDMGRFPEYLGQSITAIKLPLLIKQVKATNVNLVNREKNIDGSYAKANLNRATAEVKNITNLSSGKMLELKADAYLENKAHFNLRLSFNYTIPQFSFDGTFKQFTLTDLNPLIRSYTPASINKGVADEITFSGNASRTAASGTMKFLYHDLDIELQLKEKAKWKSSVLEFAANTVLPASNPRSAGQPPRIVEFQRERDMNKSFVNLVIKSLLTGLKETMLMSKENKKAFKQEKKEAKMEAKKERKKNKK